MKKVIFSAESRLDLLEIGDYISRDNPARARTFVAELRERARRIAFMPGAYRPRNDLQKGLRMAVHGRYLIFFEVEESAIHILRVVHGARDIPGLFQK